MKWKEIEAILKRPFDDHEINWMPKSTSRDGTKVLLLAYMDARGVRDRLDEAFGPHWKSSYAAGPSGGVMCTLSIKWEGEWISRCGVAENTNIEAVKGGASDALKRAATAYGIGRHLYDLGVNFVKLQDKEDYSVPEGRRIYTKQKHAVAPSIRKLQPELFGEPEPKKPKPKKPKPEPAREHDKDWDKDRNFFQMKVKKIGFTYDEVCYIMEVLKKDRPSQMSELARANLLGWLENLSPQTRDRYKDDFKVDCQGAPSKGERNE